MTTTRAESINIYRKLAVGAAELITCLLESRYASQGVAPARIFAGIRGPAELQKVILTHKVLNPCSVVEPCLPTPLSAAWLRGIC